MPQLESGPITRQTNGIAMVESEPPMEPGVVSYRRNGKLFSCEPCRKGKLRCDHNSPVCGRCARRNKQSQCVYHPAPLTRTRTSPDAGAERTSSSRAGSHRASPYPSREQPATVPRDPSGVNQACRNANRHSLSSGVNSAPAVDSFVPSPMLPLALGAAHGRAMSSSISHRSPDNFTAFRENNGTGFLGPTAYSAVYTENLGGLGAIEPDDTEQSANLPPVHPDLIQRGADVLALFQDMPRYRKFTQRWFDLSESAILLQAVFRIWFDDMWNEFQDVLTEARPDKLYAMSELVWRNTRCPVELHSQMTAQDWAAAASGKSLRWEVIGIILSCVGLVAVNLSDWDIIFDDIREKIVDRATFSERMRKASELVLCFCYECEVLNDLYICFMYEGLCLIELLKGDSHYTAWQRNGELCDAMVAMGLHQYQEGPDTPFFLCQQRKRMFASAYIHDKSISLFVGRPPRLSYRYCKLEMPLDLSGDQLVMQGADLENAIARLDPEGWNTDGCVYRVTWNRVWFLYSRIREEILEVSLGSDSENVEQRISEIWAKMENLDASLPSFVRVSPETAGLDDYITISGRRNEDGILDNTRPSNAALSAIFVHLGMMQTEFMLRRAQVNRTKACTETLIPISRRMLKLVLLAQTRRDFFRDFQGDVACLLAEVGVSSAGVLAVELLKQEQSREITQDILPRSDTIQDISVLISLLADVKVGDANHHICKQGRRALKGALDKILSPSAPPPVNSGGLEPEKAFDEMSFFMPTANDAEFLQWLDKVEWDKGFIMNPVADPSELTGM